MASDCGLRRAECERHVDAIRFDREYYRLGFRSIARDTDERTLIFSLFPKNCGVGHSLNVSVPKAYRLSESRVIETDSIPYERTLFAMAWLNSLPADWIARFMIQINASKTYLARLPIPQPDDDEIRSNPDYTALARNALLLTLANDWNSFQELAPLFGIQREDLPATPKAYDLLRYANDTIVARLYGISKRHLGYILESFPVLTSKRPEYVALFGR